MTGAGATAADAADVAGVDDVREAGIVAGVIRKDSDEMQPAKRIAPMHGRMVARSVVMESQYNRPRQ